MGRSRLLAGIVTLLTTALLAAGCSRDPEAVKRDHLARGDRYLQDKKYSEAILEYRNLVQADPKSGQARRKLAEAYLQSGDAANGYREYVRAADLLPDDNDVQLTAGGLRLLARQYEDAQTMADKVLARDPSNVRALILRANALAGLKNVDDAVKEIEEAIQLDPAGSELYTNLGGLEFRRNHIADAEAALQRAVALDPKSARARTALGNFYWTTKRADDAEQAFRKAVELEPADPAANRMLAIFYLTTGRRAEAEKPLKALADASPDVNPRLRLADYYLLGGKRDEGIRILQNLAADKQGRIPAKARLALVAYSEGRRDEAHRIVDELLKTDPRNPQALLLRARFLFMENKMDEALAGAKAVVAADPRSVKAFFLLGQIQLARRDNQEATKAFSEVLRLNPRVAAAQVQLSRLNLAAGNPASAVQFAEQAVRTAPNVAETHLALARSLMARGDVVRAENELKQLDRRYPDSAVINVQLGNLYISKKDYSQARRAYDLAYKKDPASLDALSGLIAVDLLASKPQDARTRMEAHLARNAQNPGALVLAAKTYAATHDLPRAEGMLRKAIEVDASNLSAYGMLGQMLYAQGRLAEGRTEFENLLKRQPDSVAANTMLAMIVSSQGHPDEAKTYYQKALAIDPRAAVAANNLAWIYSSRGENLEVALQLAQTASAQLPDQPEVTDTLAYVYQKQGLPKLAIPLLKKVIEKDPKNPLYHYHLGLAYASSGDSQGAREALGQALTLNPKFADADDARRVLAQLR